MEKCKRIFLIPNAEVSKSPFDYPEFNRQLNELTPEQFDKFCNAIKRLTEFYDCNIGEIWTDQPNKVNAKNMNNKQN